jgi:mono/diheme cytochrome c family protein
MRTAKLTQSAAHPKICRGNLLAVAVFGITIFSGAAWADDDDDDRRNPYGDVEGAEVFLKYCAGCHGFDGFAEFPPAPSFAMGDRLHKDDNTLLQSVLKGKGAMPSWEDKLPIHMLREAIEYLRTMNERRLAGLEPRNHPLPDFYYKFRPIGSTDPYNWYFPIP